MLRTKNLFAFLRVLDDSFLMNVVCGVDRRPLDKFFDVVPLVLRIFSRFNEMNERRRKEKIYINFFVGGFYCQS